MEHPKPAFAPDVETHFPSSTSDGSAVKLKSGMKFFEAEDAECKGFSTQAVFSCKEKNYCVGLGHNTEKD